MGCTMNRKLNVPIAVQDLYSHESRIVRTRKLRASESEDLRILGKLAENRMRIERLVRDIERNPETVDCSEISNELEYIKANIQLGLVELGGEIEETPSADDIFDQATA